MTFFVCPQCRKRGVSRRRKPKRFGGDVYACRYCGDWYAYADTTDEMDANAVAALAAFNPDEGIVGAEDLPKVLRALRRVLEEKKDGKE